LTEKIRVALIFHKNSKFLSGSHFDNTYYNFFIKAWKRNQKIDVTYFPTNDKFDLTKFKNKFDIIFLWSNDDFEMPQEIMGIKEIGIPVIARCGDPVDAKNAIKFHEKWKIDYYISFYSEEFFHELYPKYFKYKTIFFGVEPNLFENVTPFQNRIKNKILLTGAIGNKKLHSRIINDILRPKWNSYRFYNLRTKCSDLSYVDYTPTLQHNFIGDEYPKLLEKYTSSITATSYNPNIKYWENSAAGCLTFMEITEKNKGKFLGYEDNKTCIMINNQNYQEKFEIFLSDPQNSKWEEIANAGREYTLKNFSNDVATESLVELMNNLV
jgi:hypothetical protein